MPGKTSNYIGGLSIALFDCWREITIWLVVWWLGKPWENDGKMVIYIVIMAGWWFGTWILWISIQLGMSSSQLMNSMIFQRGRAQPPTRYIGLSSLCCKGKSSRNMVHFPVRNSVSLPEGKSIDVLFPLVCWWIEGFGETPLATGKWW